MQINLILSSLRNAGLAKKPVATVPLSRSNISFLDILYVEGFIFGYQISNLNRNIKVYISYFGNDLPIVSSLKAVTRPGFKVFLNYKNLINKYSGRFLILSTDVGFLTGVSAISLKKGGEFLCVRYYY